MGTTLSWSDVLTALVAIYGAVLSTIVFIKEQQKNRRQVNLTLTYGFLTFDHGLSDQMLIFQISNPGYKNVTINGPQLRLHDNKSMIFPFPNSNVKFPYTLEEGKSVHTWIELKELIRGLKANGYNGTVKFKAKISDQTGKDFSTNGWTKLDLNQAYG